ncbi:hypothetical protein Ancab_003750 [Ancistrocladus abbreviatus]
MQLKLLHYPLILSSLTNPPKKPLPNKQTLQSAELPKIYEEECRRMIQELFGGGAAAATGLIGSGERKISVAEGFVLQNSSSSPSLSSSPSQLSSSNTTTATATTATTTTSNSENQNLRCPRCDSTNTKFCYYNNYNLTQPRHFCKTCRRYWTKGGALRNVPIGGGCRKNKSVGVSPAAGKSSGTKAKTLSISEFGKQSYFGNGFDQDLTPTPILWPSSPQNSHIFTLLRANQNQNPNPSPFSNAFTIKNEGPMIGTREPGIIASALNARTLGFDNSYNDQAAPYIGLCSSFLKNNQQRNGLVLEGVQSSGTQDVYQRLKSSSANYYYGDQPAVVLTSNVASSTSSTASSTILGSAPVTGGDHLAFFNPSLSWSDLATPSGAYP